MVVEDANAQNFITEMALVVELITKELAQAGCKRSVLVLHSSRKTSSNGRTAIGVATSLETRQARKGNVGSTPSPTSKGNHEENLCILQLCLEISK